MIPLATRSERSRLAVRLEQRIIAAYFLVVIPPAKPLRPSANTRCAILAGRSFSAVSIKKQESMPCNFYPAGTRRRAGLLLTVIALVILALPVFAKAAAVDPKPAEVTWVVPFRAGGDEEAQARERRAAPPRSKPINPLATTPSARPAAGPPYCCAPDAPRTRCADSEYATNRRSRRSRARQSPPTAPDS